MFIKLGRMSMIKYKQGKIVRKYLVYVILFSIKTEKIYILIDIK